MNPNTGLFFQVFLAKRDGRRIPGVSGVCLESESKHCHCLSCQCVELLFEDVLEETFRLPHVDANHTFPVGTHFRKSIIFTKISKVQDVFTETRPAEPDTGLKEFGTVWIFQMESDQALKLASIFRARRQELESKVEVSGHLDGSLFFEIGPFIQDIFELFHRQIFKQSLQKKFQLRHMLRPAFHRDINDGEPLLFFQFGEENQNKKGTMRFGIPVKFIRRLFVMRN